MQITRHSLRITRRHAFFLGALLALFALLPAILPYGGRYVTRGDYIEQQLPFILETRRILLGGADSYSFSTLLGAPAVGSYAFYTLGSPFIWPLALLPQRLIPYGISIMAVLKHAVCALCAFCYFKKMLASARLALLGSVLYTFSAFTVINTQFYHFTEIIAFFPLILLGLETAMSEHPKPGLLALACGLNTLTNYYFMFSSALLAALYFAFRFFSEDWKGARSLRRIFFTVFECGVGCALAGVILCPALIHMLSITRTGAGTAPLLSQYYTLGVLFERLRALLMPIESHVVHAFYGTAHSWSSTASYLPMFGLTGFAVFTLRGRAKKWLSGLSDTLLAACCLPVLGGVFALYTNNAYTRWWYGLALIITLCTLYALRERPLWQSKTAAPDTRRVWTLCFAVCTALCALLILPDFLPEALLEGIASLGWVGAMLTKGFASWRTGAYASDLFRVLSLGLALAGCGALLFAILRRPRYVTVLALVCVISCVQYAAFIAAGDAYILSGGESASSGVYTLEEIAGPTLSALDIQDDDAGYERIDYGRRLRNYGLLRGKSSLTCFSSLRSSTVGRFISMMNMGFDEATTVRPADASAPLRALLSVSEYHQFDDTDVVPEGFIYSHEENGFAVYTNPNAVPMGFLQTVCTGTHHQSMEAHNAAKTMLAAVTLSDAQLERLGGRMQRLDVYNIPGWEESVARLKDNACSHFDTTANGFTAQIDAKEAGLVVFTIPYDKGFTAAVDGIPAAIEQCDVAFMGIWVEPGEHEIVFTYRTRGLRIGAAMSAAAAAILGVYMLLCRKKNLLGVSV